MKRYESKQRWKFWLGIFALLIVIATLYFTNILVNNIRAEERKKVELWAEAVQRRAKLVVFTQELFAQIEEDERRKVELWAESMIITFTKEVDDYTILLKIIEGNTTIPVILTYENGEIWTWRNLEDENNESLEYIESQLAKMKSKRDPVPLVNNQYRKTITYYLYYDDSKIYTQLKRVINDLIKSFISETVKNSASVPVVFTDESQTKIIDFGNIDTTIFKPFDKAKVLDYVKGQNEPIKVQISPGVINYIFYKDSVIISRLKLFPYFQLTITGLFLIVAYLLFSTARRSEQNRVWVGMSKETAHQLGTPISSLAGWIEYLKTKDIDSGIVAEIQKDIDRLEVVSKRFSKIGSTPQLKEENIYAVLRDVVGYMRPRIPSGINLKFQQQDTGVIIPVGRELFEWVIENLIRNSVDAIEGKKGEIVITLEENQKQVIIDVSDTGKGIPKNKFKTIFKPGFTTKQRGWGLGLSLVKRIIEDYHKGKVFVKKSEPGIETVFRIVLKKQSKT